MGAGHDKEQGQDSPAAAPVRQLRPGPAVAQWRKRSQQGFCLPKLQRRGETEGTRGKGYAARGNFEVLKVVSFEGGGGAYRGLRLVTESQASRRKGSVAWKGDRHRKEAEIIGVAQRPRGGCCVYIGPHGRSESPPPRQYPARGHVLRGTKASSRKSEGAAEPPSSASAMSAFGL